MMRAPLYRYTPQAVSWTPGRFRRPAAEPARAVNVKANVTSIDKHPKALLCDIDGVLYTGNEVTPGASDTVNWLAEQGTPHLFITNNTTTTAADLSNRLQGFGLDVPPSRILNPVTAARTLLQASARQGAIVVFADYNAVYHGLSDLPGAVHYTSVPPSGEVADNVAAVVLGDLGPEMTYEALNTAFRVLNCNPSADLISLGATKFYKAADGLLLDVGPYCKALEYATSRTAKVAGKPGADFFCAGLDLLRSQAQSIGGAAGGATLHPSNVVMVGDDVSSDVGGAISAGMLGLLVMTGKFQPSDLDVYEGSDGVLESIASLPAWWQACTDAGTSVRA